MKWTKTEIAYQHVHAWWSFWLVLAAYKITGSWQAAFLGLALGIAVEAWQVIVKNESLWLFDRIRDVFFYAAGGALAIML